MEAVSVRELKNNPGSALKAARETNFVVVTNRDVPAALLVGVEQLKLPDLGRLRLALAASLFRDGAISSGAAARMAGRSRIEMFDLLARLGIPLYPADEAAGVDGDLAAIEAWLAKPKRRA